MNLFFSLKENQKVVVPFKMVERLDFFSVLNGNNSIDEFSFEINVNNYEFVSEDTINKDFINHDLAIFSNSYFPTRPGNYKIQGKLLDKESQLKIKYCDIEVILE